MEKLNPTPPEQKLMRAFLLWTAVMSVTTLIYFFLLPIRSDFSVVCGSPHFWIETLAWIPAIFISAWVSFRSQNQTLPPVISKFLPLFAPFLLVILRAPESSTLSEELDFYQGRCGYIILATGFATSFIGFAFLKKFVFLSEAKLKTTPLVSSGCFASFLMQFVCAHESPLHLFIWHFLPLMFLGIIALQCEEAFLGSSKRAKIKLLSKSTGLQIGSFL